MGPMLRAVIVAMCGLACSSHTKDAVGACPRQGAPVPTIDDAGWIEVAPDHPRLPIRFRMPPDLEGEMFDVSPTEVLYMINKPGTDGVLQLGVDSVQSPDDFRAMIKERGGKTAIEVRPAKLGGLAATEACGTVEVPLPHAIVVRDDGGSHDIDAHVQRDRYGGYFVQRGDHVFRATYRMPEKEAAQWEPMFRAILATLSWK